MKDKLLSRISNIVALVLLAVSVVIVLAMYVGPNADTITNAGGDVMNVPAATDTLIYWCYALLIATVVAVVGFAAYKFISNLIINPKGGIKTIVTLVAFAILIIVAWNLGSPEKLPARRAAGQKPRSHRKTGIWNVRLFPHLQRCPDQFCIPHVTFLPFPRIYAA